MYLVFVCNETYDGYICIIWEKISVKKGLFALKIIYSSLSWCLSDWSCIIQRWFMIGNTRDSLSTEWDICVELQMKYNWVSRRNVGPPPF